MVALDSPFCTSQFSGYWIENPSPWNTSRRDEAVRRDGFIQHLAQELGVSEGQASRRWKLLVTHFKAFAASLAAFAA